MKLAILENRPWIVMNTIRKMKSIKQIEKIDLLFYENSFAQKSEIEPSIVAECNELGVRLIRIAENDFDSKMNELYSDKDRIFFFNLVLDDNSDFFEERINVIYAKDRKDDKRIWFYTTSGNYNITKIKNMFGKQYLPVIGYDIKQDALVFEDSKLTEMVTALCSSITNKYKV